MTRPLLHIAAFWVDGDVGDELSDYCAKRKIEGTHGAVVTFKPATAEKLGFRVIMERLDLAELNEHPQW